MHKLWPYIFYFILLKIINISFILEHIFGFITVDMSSLYHNSQLKTWQRNSNINGFHFRSLLSISCSPQFIFSSIQFSSVHSWTILPLFFFIFLTQNLETIHAQRESSQMFSIYKKKHSHVGSCLIRLNQYFINI